MVNDKYVVKYLDPRTGKYEYATIKDVGDLQKLNTKVKTSIVDAINSISADDIEGLKNGLDAIGETIKSLEDGTLELGDFQSIDDVVSREIEDAINSLKLENSGLLQLTQEEVKKIVSDAESEYRDNIATSIRELETSKTDLVAAREKMINIGKMLENANIDYSNLTQVVDSINLYITDIIEKTDFDMVNGIVSDYKTAVTQTQDGWGVDASKNMLSYLTGRVKSNETSLNVQHGLIEAKVGKDEFQYMTVDNLPAGKENMLHNTFDLRDWGFSSAFIFKSADDYRFTSIVQADSAGENITGTTDELEQGVTYAISTYVNVQNKNKKPGQEKYAPTDGVYTATVIIDGDTIELNNVVEDNSALDGWKRVSGTFIAKRTAKQDIKFYITAFNRDTQVGYLSAPKFEKGSSATSWVPHIEDNVSTMLSQNAVMRVLSDRITSSVEEVRETKDAFETATSTFDQMADGFELNTNKLTEVLDKYGEVTGVQTQQASELKVLNESITSKVWKQDINTTIDTINIDTSNRIVNSAFNIYSYDEQTGALQLDYWGNNTGFAIKKHSQSLDNYLYATRSNATSVNPISIKSSPFALRDGEKILFNFEYLAVGNPLDNDNVFTLEMYDNNDVRVGLQEFRLSELKKEFLTAYDVGDSYKYNGTYIVKNSSVVKGTITLKLPKNGELWLTKVMLQNAGIGTIGWTPSSVDNQIIQSKLSTEINQLADSIELVATDERLDAINGLLVKKDGKVVISPEAIISRVTSQELGEKGLITQTSLKQTEDNLRFDLVDKDGVIQTINASAEGLLIDFDKVHIDGEVIARMISAQAIDVTQGFRLTDNNGNTLLAVVNDNGTPTLSITKEFRVKFGEVNDKLDVTIVGVVEEYYYSVDPNEPIGGRWTSTPNAFQGGDNRFIWKRTKIIYQSGDTSYYPSEIGINITGSWEYEKESVTAEVVKALDSAEAAKELAVSEANQAMIDANKYADEQDALIKQQVEASVSGAISSADQAKQIATDNYNNAVAKAEELTVAQSEAFNKKFEENTTAMGTLTQATKDAEAKAQSALTKAGVNENLLTTHQNTLNTIKNTTIPNVNKVATDAMAEAKSALTSASSAMSEAKTALSSASSAMDEAKKVDGKIADYVTKNGLVSGTTVDSKIDTATGEINKKITTVESKIPTDIGGRNLVLNTQGEHEPSLYGGSVYTLPLTKSGDYLGRELTLSFKAKSSNGTNRMYISIGTGGMTRNNITGNIVIPKEYKEYKYTFTASTLVDTTDLMIVAGTEYHPNNSGSITVTDIKLETGNIATDWTPAPEDNYTKEEFSIFESTYNEDVKGINSTLTELSNKKLDGTTYTDFYTNEYKKTAQGVTDTYAKVNKIIDANGNSTDAFAKAVYERNATRQSADFKEVTKDLVKETTYTAGIDGISKKLTTVEGKIPTYIGGRNYLINTHEEYVNDNSSSSIKLWDIADVEELRGQAVTFSFELKSSSASNGFYVSVSRSIPATVLEITREETSSTEYKKYEFTFTFPMDTTGSAMMIVSRNSNFPNNTGSTTLRKLKLEIGSVATDWTPAPEDMQSVADLDANITSIYNNTTSETAKAINQTLSAYTKDTDFDSTVASYLKSSTSATAGAINTKLTAYQTTTGLDSSVSSLLSNTNSQTAKGFNSKLTAVEAKIPTEIGGRNLALNTKGEYELEIIEGALYRLPLSASGDFVGRELTLSFKAKSSNGKNKIYASIGFSGSTVDRIADNITIPKEYKEYKYTFTSSPDDRTSELMIVAGTRWHPNNSGSITVTDIKLEKGNIATDWSPAPEDTVMENDFTVFKNSYESTVSSINSELTNYAKKTDLSGMVTESVLSTKNFVTAGSMSTTLANYAQKNNVPTNTQFNTLKNSYDSMVQTIGTNGSKIAQMVMTDSLFQTTVIDSIDIGGRNLVKDSGDERELTPSVTNNIQYDLAKDIDYLNGEEITLSFEAKSNVNGTVVEFYPRQNEKYPGFTILKTFSLSKDYKRYSYTWTYNFNRTNRAEHLFFRTSQTNNISIKGVQLEKGNVVSDWTPAPEDTSSKITQLADNINLKVSKGDISNQININAQGVVINGKKISLSGQTSVDGAFWAKEVNAVKVKADNISGTTAEFKTMVTKGLTADVISSTMIKADTALFDMLFSTTSATTRLVARGAWITNANIVSLDASKITAGTINSARINAKQIVTNGLSANVVKSTHIESSTALVDKVFATTALINQLTSKTAFINSIKAIEISASKITGTNTSFVQSSWNAINSRLSVTGSELKYTHSDGSYTRINANGIQTVVGGSSYQHNYLMHIENVTINSGSTGNVQWVQLPSVFKGKKFEYFMGVTDIYGALGDGDYSSNKMVLKRFVLIKSPKYDIDYANARIPILGYAHYVNIDSRKDYFRALQGIVVAQY